MPAAENVSYNVASQGRLRAGIVSGPAVPAWRAAQATDTWIQVPVAAALSTLNPSLDPSINPNYPSFPEYMSSLGTSWATICGAWNGGCYDRGRDEFLIPLTGGHADYAGNDYLALELRKDAPTWVRRCKPSGWDGSVQTLDQARLRPGSSGSTLVFASGVNAPLLYTGDRDEASDVDGFYVGMKVHVFGQAERTITAYAGATRTATVDVAFSGDQSGKLYAVANGPMVHGLKAEGTGRYSDGRARAVHTYNIPVYADLDDAPWMPVGGSGSSWSATQSNFQTLRVDRVNGAHTFSASPNNTIAASPFGAATAYDPTRGAKGSIWYIGQHGSAIGRLDLATRVWSQPLSFGVRSGEQCMCYLSGLDLLLIGSSLGAWAIYDPVANTLTSITVNGTPAGSNTSFGKASLEYVPKDGCVYWWNNPAGSTTVINKMAVPVNPKTNAWTITQTTPAGSNAVTPTAAQTNGTYGRFRYSSVLDGFLLFNDVAGPVYFYARGSL